MEYLLFFAVLIGIFILLFIKGFFDEKRALKRLREKYIAEAGTKPTRQYSLDEIENIKKEFERYKDEHCIDDITAEDISINDIFKRVNYSKSSAGDTHLYAMLRDPNLISDREAFEKKVRFFTENPKDRADYELYFNKIGRMLKVSFFDCLDYFDTVNRKSLIPDLLSTVFLIAGIALIFVYPTGGILATVAALVYNILTYYSERGVIEPYIVTFSYIYRFIKEASSLANYKTEVLSDENKKIKECVDDLKPFMKNAGIVTSGRGTSTGVGNPFEMIGDYLAMTLHLDIIKFYQMLDVVKNNKETIEKLYITLGEIEGYINVSLLRESLNGQWCVPKKGEVLSVKEGYHPLIEDPVKNSIRADKGVLITGSNASGKSTFLKTVLINVIFAQNLNTAFASEYEAPSFSVFSSMSLRDDLGGKDSYFMVEIKAVKRIIDYASQNPDKRILCFVDEVLRGTNTVERIAASTEILRYLSNINCVTFAATHDGELTFLLEDLYDNYHFEEEIIENDVLFNYRLNEGRATSRNAIKLLSVMGFNSSIVDSASERAAKFLEGGTWEV
ncbi:MAG: hypothetical protein J6U67_09490 [Lachnospiraceae bacterium]|nr:hypothetical protein [Lachnospiraceae bacterium]